VLHNEQEHDQEVQALWGAYREGRNTRVPITFACDEQVWLKASGRRFGDFYRIPEVHLQAQLEGQLWFRRNVVGDGESGLPDTWRVIVRDWMEENDFCGCKVVYQEDDYAWGLPLEVPKEDLLGYLGDLDPDRQVECSHSYRMYCALRELTDGMTFHGRPVEVVRPGGGTTGLFTKGSEIRGIDALCMDLYDDPEFAHAFLDLFTDMTIARIRAWRRLDGDGDPDLANPDRFHFPDDSIQLLSPDLYERFVMPRHERLYREMTTGDRSLHLCGYATQHFDSLAKRLGVTSIDGPGPFVDHGKHLEQYGTDFSFAAQMDHTILEQGTREEIRAMMRSILNPTVKIPGRFQLMGFVNKLTPLENVRACYEAGREFGVIS
jgi:hypothetical protein